MPFDFLRSLRTNIAHCGLHPEPHQPLPPGAIYIPPPSRKELLSKYRQTCNELDECKNKLNLTLGLSGSYVLYNLYRYMKYVPK